MTVGSPAHGQKNRDIVRRYGIRYFAVFRFDNKTRDQTGHLDADALTALTGEL